MFFRPVFLLFALSITAAAQQPAPIERVAPTQNSSQTPATAPQAPPLTAGVINSRPAQGIYLRAAANATVQTVSSTPDAVELRVQSGVVNITVHHPVEHIQILIDLPGGQTALLKDGLYTFNAATNTVRVLKGEAEAFASADTDAKSVKIKEDHQLVFNGPSLRSTDVGFYQAAADLLPSPRAYRADGPAYPAYGYGPYGDGFYGGYPYSAYGWDYPYYGYGYPFGFGLGFGYGGGFYGGGFRGGYGGFRGRR